MPTVKTYTVIDREGKKISFTNNAKFCKDNDLNRGEISKLAAGKIKQHKGFTAVPKKQDLFNAFMGIKCPV